MNRDPTTVRRSVAGAFVVSLSRHELGRKIERLAELFPLPVFFPSGAGLSPADLRARGWFAGTPDEIAAHVEAFASAGVDRVILQQLDLADEESIEMLAGALLS